MEIGEYLGLDCMSDRYRRVRVLTSFQVHPDERWFGFACGLSIVAGCRCCDGEGGGFQTKGQTEKRVWSGDRSGRQKR